MISKDIKVLRVDKGNVNEARDLVLKGLSEYFDLYNPDFNPDLSDILKSYSEGKGTFLVGTYEDKVIGTGALIEESEGIGRVVRMSTDKQYRKCGVASKILKALEEIAREKGYSKIVLETTKTWIVARWFYISNGYVEDHEDEEDVHFYKSLWHRFKNTEA